MEKLKEISEKVDEMTETIRLLRADNQRLRSELDALKHAHESQERETSRLREALEKRERDLESIISKIDQITL